ncbi:hypothetical protein J4462_03080 [Candidatus Pacearchaeota archaeon]|nr:hypothetical protein [Candidatus Pacearchaeota archaeon]
MAIKIDDVVFWLLIAAIVGIALWLLSGSPPEISAIISLALFVGASEILLWNSLFSLDKKTSIGFMKVRNDLNIIKMDLSDITKNVNQIHTKLESIQNLIMKRK